MYLLLAGPAYAVEPCRRDRCLGGSTEPDVRQFHHVAGTEFVEDRLLVVPHGVAADTQACGDLLLPQPFGYEVGDLRLPWREFEHAAIVHPC